MKEYLEHGRKAGRELARDELDERVVLAGDLDVTDAIIQSIETDPGVDRYLSITLSFREDEVSIEAMQTIVREFEAFVFAAYQPGEYNFYAEAHLPRVKSYQDKRTGELVERKPHIHVVLPKMNLITGQHMEPLGYVKSNIRFIDAFQEHMNAKYGFASPKNNRRVAITDASEMISRYKGDLFGRANRELKESLLDTVLDNRIENYADFMALLAKRGETRLRNAGKENEYPNVRLPGEQKGLNLKEHVFSRAFIELPTAEKLLHLSADTSPVYEIAGAPRGSSAAILATLDEWHATRAREVKYLNSGNARQYQSYREASTNDRLLMLSGLERDFYSQHTQDRHESGSAQRVGAKRNDEHGQRAGRPGRVYEFERGGFRDDRHAIQWGERPAISGNGAGRGPGAGQRSGPDRFVGIADRWQYGVSTDRTRAPAPAIDSVRGLPGLPVDRFAARRAVLVPDHALHELEQQRAVPADSLRRDSDRERTAVKPSGRVADSSVSQLARDVRERREQGAAQGQPGFTTIRRELDAARLLAELSHTHGVRPEKYRVTKGRDGAARIRCGTRHLNVSDFLTKELNLPWRDAAPILREVYAQQSGGAPARQPRELPRAALWREYTAVRDVRSQERRDAWRVQRESERTRRDAIRQTFNDARDAARKDDTFRPSERRAAVSLARMTRVEQEIMLREAVAREREGLKTRHGDAAGQSFSAYLQERAQAGDDRALAELRRIRSAPVPEPTETENHIRPAIAAGVLATRNEVVFRAPALTWEVHRNGDVTYQHDGRDVVCDHGPSVQVLQFDREALEAGLRLSQAKFGNVLELSGSQAFRLEAARVAADAGLYVEFSDDSLNQAMQARRAELVAQRAVDVNRGVAARGFAPAPDTPTSPSPGLQTGHSVPDASAPDVPER